jgi:DNA-binding response OmpR family regulator
MALTGELAFILRPNLRNGLGLGRPPRVLLAEDDDELRWALAGALAREGFAVEQVTSGAELLARLSDGGVAIDRAPDIVVSDVRMPGYNGVSVIRSLRASGWRMPVVFISAFDYPLECMPEVDVTMLMRKPVRVPDLVGAVETMIRTVRANEIHP